MKLDSNAIVAIITSSATGVVSIILAIGKALGDANERKFNFFTRNQAEAIEGFLVAASACLESFSTTQAIETTRQKYAVASLYAQKDTRALMEAFMEVLESRDKAVKQERFNALLEEVHDNPPRALKQCWFKRLRKRNGNNRRQR